MKRSLVILTICLQLFFAYQARSQDLPDSIASKVDQLFSKWASSDKPGCVVGIVSDGNLVYQKGFGLAQLENKSRNTPESIYYMCSVSKQFTGYAIASLANEGKIKLDADIHTYLPGLPQFSKIPITVNHLLHHTSGIRDDIMLSRFFGLGAEGILTQQSALQMISKQRSLNFSPGEKFSYSNSNYVLLAAIVESVSGKSFAAYTDSVIFKPLQMHSSKFVDDYTTLIPDRANSYSAEKDGYHNSPQNIYTMGDGGLFTNVTDMAKWITALCAKEGAHNQVVEMMTTTGRLKNGQPLSYAMGINVNQDRERKYFSHNGGLAGYRTIMAVYPEQKAGFLIFGNGGDGEVYSKLSALVDIFIPKIGGGDNQTPNLKAQLEINSSDTASLIQFSGNYIAKNGYQVSFTYKDKGLILGGIQPMVADSIGIFHLKARPAVRYRFTMNKANKSMITQLSSPALQSPILLEKIEPISATPSQLQQYCGRYYCDELDYTFSILLKDNALWIIDKNNNQAKVTPAGSKHLFSPIDYMAHFNVQRGKQNQIIGLELNSGEVSGLVFKKKNPQM